jgi:hypothetical protein
MKKINVLTTILKYLCKNRSVTYSYLTAIIIYLIVASYSFNFYNLANRANIGGCKVNFTAKNTNEKNAYPVSIPYISVRIKGGTWEAKYPPSGSDAVASGKSVLFPIDLDFGCSIKRQYRIYLEYSTSDGKTPLSYYYYYPSSSSWTTKTTIDLGDLSRFFK